MALISLISPFRFAAHLEGCTDILVISPGVWVNPKSHMASYVKILLFHNRSFLEESERRNYYEITDNISFFYVSSIYPPVCIFSISSIAILLRNLHDLKCLNMFFIESSRLQIHSPNRMSNLKYADRRLVLFIHILTKTIQKLK